MRVAITRHDADGTVIDGTALCEGTEISDFRDLDGEPLALPPGSSFVMRVDPEAGTFQ